MLQTLEDRTTPPHQTFGLSMLFYVPPLQPVQATKRNGTYEILGSGKEGLTPMLGALEAARLPLRYMARLFTAGNTEIIKDVYRKLITVRIYMGSQKIGDVPQREVEEALRVGKTTPEEAEAIWRLTALPTFEERFVIPPPGAEMAVEAQFPTLDPVSRNYPTRKGEVGFGFRKEPARRW